MNRFRKRITTVLCSAMMLGSAVASTTETRAADVLTIGSKAPSLEIEHWVSDGNGRYPHINDFEDGKVYVVEFWATWCGPCISSMPHLAETQLKHADDGLQFISVSTEGLKTVEKFLERKVRGKDDQTYGDLTSVYCLTTDPDGSVNSDYMKAASQNGIPTAFIVGKDGHVEWIGHPMEMDDPIEKVLNDEWDREAFAGPFKAAQEAERLMTTVYRDVEAAKSAEDALNVLTEAISTTENDALKLQLSIMKLEVMTQTEATSSEIKTVAEQVFELTSTPSDINEISWLIYQGSSVGAFKGKELVELAISKTLPAVDEIEAALKPSMLDTLAHLYELSGDLKKAIEYQTMALEGSENKEEKALMQKYLDELKEKMEDE